MASVQAAVINASGAAALFKAAPVAKTEAPQTLDAPETSTNNTRQSFGEALKAARKPVEKRRPEEPRAEKEAKSEKEPGPEKKVDEKAAAEKPRVEGRKPHEKPKVKNKTKSDEHEVREDGDDQPEAPVEQAAAENPAPEASTDDAQPAETVESKSDDAPAQTPVIPDANAIVAVVTAQPKPVEATAPKADIPATPAAAAAVAAETPAPSAPAQPDQPDQPRQLNQPSQLNKTNQPAQSRQPDQPVQPAQPDQPERPEAPKPQPKLVDAHAADPRPLPKLAEKPAAAQTAAIDEPRDQPSPSEKNFAAPISSKPAPKPAIMDTEKDSTTQTNFSQPAAAVPPTASIVADTLQTTTPSAAPEPAKPDAPTTPSPLLATGLANLQSHDVASADPAAPAQQLPAPDADQTFDQVILGLRGKLDARNGKAEIQLNPPNLGTLHVSLSLHNGSLTAEFQSSSDLVRDLLKAHMDKLKSVLEGNGVAVDRLAVEPPPPSTAEQSATTAPSGKNIPGGSANHDGRSAGNYGREPNGGQRRTATPGSFAKLWRDNAKDDAPIDVVA